MDFPTKPDDFDNDPRIWKEDGVYHLLDDHKKEWEFHEGHSKWNKLANHVHAQPGINDEDVAQFQQGFARSPEADEAVPAQAGKKRKTAADSNAANSKKPRVQENRAIFVSNLPSDATLMELEEQFCKYGIIDMSVDGTKRIKMYTDDDGNFKGEALIVYFKKDSVNLAIDFADGYELRYGGERISVKEADMSFKRNQDTDVVKSKMGRKEKKDKERAFAEMNRKLAEWDSDDEAAKEAHPAPKNKWAKFVIIKNAFSLAELDEDIQAISDIKEDFMEAGAEYGTVTNVVVYDREPSGIVSVRFSEDADAEKFAKKAHGMPFGDRDGVQQYLTAWIAQDRPNKYKKSGKGTESDEEEESARLEAFVNADTS